MRNIALIVMFVLGICLLAPAQAFAETEVRVYWGVGIVVGGLSIFLSFGSGDLSEKEPETMTAENADSENMLLAKAITSNADIHPMRYKTPGTVTIFSW